MSNQAPVQEGWQAGSGGYSNGPEHGRLGRRTPADAPPVGSYSFVVRCFDLGASTWEPNRRGPTMSGGRRSGARRGEGVFRTNQFRRKEQA